MAITVVVVDDHPYLRRAMCLFLEASGEVEIVGEAANGSGAVKLVTALCPAVAIIDLGLPDVDDMDLLIELHKTRPETRLLVVSARLDKPTAVRAFEAGAAGAVIKDRILEELLSAILDVATHAHHSPVWIPE